MKRMSKKQWYETLDKYNKLIAKQQEYGDYFTERDTLIEAQHNLMSQYPHVQTEVRILQYKCPLHEVPRLQVLIMQINTLFSKIEALEPLTEEDCQNSYIKAPLVFFSDIMRLAIILIVFMILSIKIRI